MSFPYGQGYNPSQGNQFPGQGPAPGGPYGGPPRPAAGYGPPTAGGAPGAPYGHYGSYGTGGGAPPGPSFPGGPYGGYGQPQGGPYGQQPPAGNIPPGVNPEAYQWFQSVDTDHSGYLSLKELKQALVNSNWSAFNDETCLMMINMFDKSRSGRMDIFGFSALWVFLQQWRTLFQQYDRDHSGNISSNELHQALGQMGYNLSPQFVQTVVSRYSPRGVGAIQLDRFIQVCTQLQSMTEAFGQRDTGRTGNVRMSYEEFLSTAIVRLM